MVAQMRGYVAAMLQGVACVDLWQLSCKQLTQ
jgi:hypothetical protein